MVCAHVAFHAGPFESSKYRRSGRDLLGDKSCRAKKKKKKSIFSTHDARTSGTRVPSGLLSRIHTLEAYTRNTNIMESAGYGEGRGGREEGSASSQRGTIGARVMRRPPTKRSWYAHSALPTVPFARRTTYMLPLYVPRRPANKPLPLIDALRFFRDRQRDRRMRERAKVFSRLPVSFARYSLSLSLFLRSVEKERKKKKVEVSFERYGYWSAIYW